MLFVFYLFVLLCVVCCCVLFCVVVCCVVCCLLSLVVVVRGSCWWCGCWFGPPPDRPKFRSFFSLSRHNFYSFLPLLLVFRSRRGFTQQPENSKRAHWRPRRFKHHQNSTRRPTREGKKLKTVAGEGKKSAKFWASTVRAPTLRGPTLRGPTLLAPTLRGPTTSGPHPSALHFFYFGPAPFGATPLGVPPFGAQKGACSSMFFHCFEKQESTETVKLAKVGLAKVGHPNFGQSRSIKVGQSRSNFFGQSRSNKDGQSRFGQSRSQPKANVE